MFTLTFSQKVDNQNVPFYLNGSEAQLRVDAPDKTSAIYHANTVAFCQTNGTTVRGVS